MHARGDPETAKPRRLHHQRFFHVGRSRCVVRSGVFGDEGRGAGALEAAAKELGPCGIRVNAVSCGMIETQMNARFSAEEVAAFTDAIPSGRQGLPEEVAQAVRFLAESKYITGEILRVNGGAVMQMFRPAGHFNRMLSMFPRVVRMITPIPGNL